MDLIARAEARRVAALARLDPSRQAALGQFFTPVRAATLIASMPQIGDLSGPVRILDPGAGVGNLTAALVSRLTREHPRLPIQVVAVELDPAVLPYLAETLQDCASLPGVTCELVAGDFVTGALGADLDPRLRDPFDFVIMNPPYGKLGANHPYRRALAAEVVDCPNLYAAFWSLGIRACRSGGQVVAIVPRSFANGVYFEPFRKWLLGSLGLDTLHVFESRNTVFADTGVLQENVIVSGTAHGHSRRVTLSTSVGHTDRVARHDVAAATVVQPDDPHQFIRFTDGGANVPEAARHTLADLGLKVSTGRVVDFRCRPWLSSSEETDTAPLVYPANVHPGWIEWPLDIRKPQWFRISTPESHKWLVPAGFYTVIKRFSAKEERRRVVAAVWDLPGPPAFENHLNYIHEGGRGIPLELARGLSAWLNSTPLDQLFRTFSGHTQVNAGDVRGLPFPSRAELTELGQATGPCPPRQQELDVMVESILGTTAEMAS